MGIKLIILKDMILLALITQRIKHPHIYQNNSSAPPIDGVRLKFSLLHHWTFKTGNGGDFEARMRGLRVRTHEDEEDKPEN